MEQLHYTPYRWLVLLGFAIPVVASAIVPAVVMEQVRLRPPKPVVQIVAVDGFAYESPFVPTNGVETSETPTRNASFRVTRTGLLDRSLTVFYTVSGTAENGVDYVALPGRVTIPAGSAGARIVIRPIDDGFVERRTVGEIIYPNDTIIVKLRSNDAYRTGASVRADALIIDDDDYQPQVNIGTSAFIGSFAASRLRFGRPPLPPSPLLAILYRTSPCRKQLSG